MGNVRGLAMQVWNRACAHVTPRYAIQMYRNGRTSNLRGNDIRIAGSGGGSPTTPRISRLRCSLSLSLFSPLISFAYQSVVSRITARMMKPVARDRDINPDQKISSSREERRDVRISTRYTTRCNGFRNMEIWNGRSRVHVDTNERNFR